MKRIETQPRADWQAIVEKQGLIFHTAPPEESGEQADPAARTYWNESAFYEFTEAETDSLSSAALALNDLCLEALDTIISTRQFGPFEIPEPFHEWIVESWEKDEVTVSGRFDLVMLPGREPKLLEYNADTPTGLLEAAVIQWTWLQDVFGDGTKSGEVDQWNSIHERLIEAWQRVGAEIIPAAREAITTSGLEPARLTTRIPFVGMTDSDEDAATLDYLRDVATQAGFETVLLPMEQLGFIEGQDGRTLFVDAENLVPPLIAKLYPWEWMMREAAGQALPVALNRWMEPPWKALLSTKALLPVLWNLFPDHPNLLRASFEPLPGGTYAQKPIHGREGSNVRLFRDGKPYAETPGPWSDQTSIYQEITELPAYNGHHPVLGTWIVNGNACGLGIREDNGLITGNTSRFVPHIIRG